MLSSGQILVNRKQLRYSRRKLIASLAASTAVAPFSSLLARQSSECVFGAIRWDAHYCDTPGQPCFEEETALGNPKWQFRAPLHTKVAGPNEIHFSPSQDSFDREIKAASTADLKYWAYLVYGKNGEIDFSNSMMNGLAFHRSSHIKSAMQYAMIATVDTLGHTGSYDQALDKLITLIGDANYLRVLGGRPVLYIYYLERLLRSYWGSLTNLSEGIDALRAKSEEAGIGMPYIIVLAGPPENAERIREAIKADAISAYAITLPRLGQETPYRELGQFVRDYWLQELAATTADVVPTVMVGWDDRPRKERPPFFDQRKYSPAQQTAHVVRPTPSEFAGECEAARNFRKANLDRCPSKLALIYAWNEDSEGGSLQPTIGDPEASLLRAAAPIFR
jgi:hypothetical protein